MLIIQMRRKKNYNVGNSFGYKPEIHILETEFANAQTMKSLHVREALDRDLLEDTIGKENINQEFMRQKPDSVSIVVSHLFAKRDLSRDLLIDIRIEEKTMAITNQEFMRQKQEFANVLTMKSLCVPNHLNKNIFMDTIGKEKELKRLQCIRKFLGTKD